jgi:hypothetical protein
MEPLEPTLPERKNLPLIAVVVLAVLVVLGLVFVLPW